MQCILIKIVGWISDLFAPKTKIPAGTTAVRCDLHGFFVGKQLITRLHLLTRFFNRKKTKK